MEGKYIFWIAVAVSGLLLFLRFKTGSTKKSKKTTTSATAPPTTSKWSRMNDWRTDPKNKNWVRLGLILMAYITLHITIAYLYPTTAKWFWAGIFDPWKVVLMHVLAILGIIGFNWGSAPTDKPIHIMGGVVISLVILAFIYGAWEKASLSLPAWNTSPANPRIVTASHNLDDMWEGHNRVIVIAPVGHWSREVPIPRGKRLHFDEASPFYMSKDGSPIKNSKGEEILFLEHDRVNPGSPRFIQVKSGTQSELAITMELLDP